MAFNKKILIAFPLGIIFGVGGFAAYNFFADNDKGKIIDLASEAGGQVNDVNAINEYDNNEIVDIKPLDIGTAFELAYGGTNPTQSVNVDGYVFKPVKLLEVKQSPILISLGALENGSHADGGIVAIDYFENVDGNYQKIPQKHYELETGSWGNLSDLGINNKLLDNPVVTAEGGGTYQGISCGKTTFINLGENSASEILSVVTTYDDSGFSDAADAKSFQGQITNIIKEKSFDINYRGTKNFTIEFKYNGKKYVATGDTSQIKNLC